MKMAAGVRRISLPTIPKTKKTQVMRQLNPKTHTSASIPHKYYVQYGLPTTYAMKMAAGMWCTS